MNNNNLSINNVAGVVVLYNSPLETIDNIYTYINQVSKLYVVDNSTSPNDALIEILRNHHKVSYHSFKENLGIATALNWAANQAIEDRYELLLTMDDDTKTPPSMIIQMLDFWNHCNEPIGILSGVHHNKVVDFHYRSLLYTLTSGNLLNLMAYKTVGKFNDNLFIDHVDHEYGIRLNDYNYKVIELQSIHLDHRLGERQKLTVGPLSLGEYGSHSDIRFYYFARNGIYLSMKYFTKRPTFIWMVVKEIVKRFLKSFFIPNSRAKRINMLIYGIVDGYKGKLGQYRE